MCFWIEIQERGHPENSCRCKPRESLLVTVVATTQLRDCIWIICTLKIKIGSVEEELRTKIPQKECPTTEAQKTSVYYASKAK
jgi:hypothetical protein